MFAFVMKEFFESLKFRPKGKKCQIELIGYANERLSKGNTAMEGLSGRECVIFSTDAGSIGDGRRKNCQIVRPMIITNTQLLRR